MSPGSARSPSLAVGEHFEGMYNSLDPSLKKMISEHPMVAGGHLSPAAALNIMHYDRKSGERLGDTVARTMLKPSGPAAAVGAAGPQRSMATNAGGRPRSSTAATLGPPRLSQLPTPMGVAQSEM